MAPKRKPAAAAIPPVPTADDPPPPANDFVPVLPDPPPVTPAIAASAVELVPFETLFPSPLNPRKTFPEATIEEMVASIKASGLLQPLTGRRGADGRVEVYIGGRRWRALDRLRERNEWPHDRLPGGLVPVTIRDVDDRELLKVAVAENVNREDMHPLEEGEAFAAMLDRDPTLTTAAIGEIYGKTSRWVQERVRVARQLAAPAAEAFRTGDMTYQQAKALSRAPVERQEVVIKKHGNLTGYQPSQIEHMVTECYPKESAAIFPLDYYRGPWIEPEREGEERRFQDLDMFQTMQRLAVEKKLQELRERFGWADKVTNQNRWWDPTGWQSGHRKAKSTDAPKKVGAIILVCDDYTVVKVFEGIVKAPSAKAAEERAEDPVKAIGPKRLDYARRVRGEALQLAVFRDPHVAMARLALALLGVSDGSSIKLDEYWGDSRGVHPEILAVLERHRDQMGAALFSPLDPDNAGRMLRSRRSGPYQHAGPDSAATDPLFEALLKMDGEDLVEFVAALTAARTHCGWHSALGDPELAQVTASTVELDMAEAWRIDAGYLALLKGDELFYLAHAINLWCSEHGMDCIDIKAVQAAKVGERRSLLLAHIEEHDVRLVPPEVEFGPQKAVEAAVRDWAQERAARHILPRKPAKEEQLDLEDAIAAKVATARREALTSGIDALLDDGAPATPACIVRCPGGLLPQDLLDRLAAELPAAPNYGRILLELRDSEQFGVVQLMKASEGPGVIYEVHAFSDGFTLVRIADADVDEASDFLESWIANPEHRAGDDAVEGA